MGRVSCRAFTLVELLFCLFILALLLLLAYPHITAALDEADYMQCESHVQMIRRAKTAYVLDHMGATQAATSDDQAVFRAYLPQTFDFSCPRSPGTPYSSPYHLYFLTTCPYCALHPPLGGASTTPH